MTTDAILEHEDVTDTKEGSDNGDTSDCDTAMRHNTVTPRQQSAKALKPKDIQHAIAARSLHKLLGNASVRTLRGTIACKGFTGLEVGCADVRNSMLCAVREKNTFSFGFHPVAQQLFIGTQPRAACF